MKKFIITLFSLGLVFSQSSYADIQNNKPLWSQTNELICSGVSRFNCTESNCEKGDSSALWKVDFPGQKITFLGQIKMEYIIQDRFFNYWENIGESKHVIYFFGRIMDFDLDNDSELNPINASLVDNNWIDGNVNISSMLFRCYPQ